MTTIYSVRKEKSAAGRFVSILKNGKLIEPLEGIYMANPSEEKELRELVELANKGAQSVGIAEIKSLFI